MDIWDVKALGSLPCPFSSDWIRRYFGRQATFPNTQCLNDVSQQANEKLHYRFIEQHPTKDSEHDFASNLSSSSAHYPEHDYYENIIALHKCIPTRGNNLHDFFNAIIWQQYPQTKALISQFHAQDIANFGLSPRTPRRDRLTHFDECGILLLVKQCDIEHVSRFFHALATHQWQTVFVDEKESWHSIVQPCVFGHATLEMLLNPFVGLTAKWLVVEIDNEFDRYDEENQRNNIDQNLSKTLSYFNGLDAKDILRPLPVLGIPGWYAFQTSQFYANRDYFRAQRTGTPLTRQLPLGLACQN